jgi:hypothetical protein
MWFFCVILHHNKKTNKKMTTETARSAHTAGTILDNITASNEKVTKIGQELFNVKPIQLHPNIEGFNSPESFGIYKTSGGNPLGVVGSQFVPTQPKDLFDPFVECLERNGVDVGELNYKEFKGGAKIMFTAPVGRVVFKNMKGAEDESIVKMNLFTGYDGHTATSMFLSTYRLICSNGAKAWKTDFAVKYRNTMGNTGKIQMMCDSVLNTLEMMPNLREFMEHMNKVQITPAQVDEYIFKVTGMHKKEYSEYSKRKQNIFDDINQSVGLEFSRTGESVWGLYNGITHYTNHVASKNGEEFVMVDSGLEMNNKAQKFALELMN